MKQGEWPRLLIGVAVVFALFQWIASGLGSFRGEAGILVGLVVVIATVKVERLLFTEPVGKAALSIGLGRPKASGIIVAVVIAAIMLGSAVIFGWGTASGLELYPNWQWLAIGIFCQAGIAEEALFRGFLFGHMRQRHTFGKAATFAAIPFVLVHLILFYSFPWSLAGASILLSIAISFPLSKLFEMSGNTIWAPAIVHFATQSMAKLIVPSGENSWLYPFVVIAVSTIVPLIVYLLPTSRLRPATPIGSVDQLVNRVQ